MATIITRVTGATAKGSPLTNAEVDANFINLNTNKVENNSTASININGTVGATTPSTGIFTFVENPATLTADHTLAAGYNAVSAGPLTIGEGVTITLSDTSNWSIV